MKNFMVHLLLAFVLISFFGFSPGAKTKLSKEKDCKVVNLSLKKHVDVTIRSTSGCTFHIVGDVYYQLCCPPQINDFVGDVTIGGSSTCPHATFHFGARGSMDDNYNVTSLTYYDGDEEAINALTDPDVDAQIRTELSNIIIGE
jgi:hypothetical protein